MEMQQQQHQQQRLIPKEHKNLAKGFVIGFIVAQFVNWWISYPAIIISLVLYVFVGHATRYILDLIVAYVPGVALIVRFIKGYRAVTDLSNQNPFGSPNPDTSNSYFGPPARQPPSFYSGQGTLV